MKAKLRRWMAPFLAYAAISCIFSLWLRFSYFSPDPDRLYQLSLSREVALRGLVLPNLPQAEDIGWADYFPDKEFGYHALTGLGFSLREDQGALAVSAAIAAALLLFSFSSSSPLNFSRASEISNLWRSASSASFCSRPGSSAAPWFSRASAQASILCATT